jgi:transposase
MTKDNLWELRIEVLWWPPKSLDLSPIENVWPWIKDWIESRPEKDIQDLNPTQLRRALVEA